MTNRSEHPDGVSPDLEALVRRAATRQLPFDTPAEIEPVVEEIVGLLGPLVRSRTDLDRLSRVLPDLVRMVRSWSDETPMGYLHDYDTAPLRACILGCDTVGALADRLK